MTVRVEELSLFGKMFEDLLNEKRVAFGFLINDVHQRFRRRTAPERREQRCDHVFRKSFERDSLDQTLPDELRERFFEGLAYVELDVAIGAENEHRKLGKALRQMLQQQKAGSA
ncbi:MAG: hypothetical protein BMS9Abin37_2524 [Acidobacteriota bacterium]|nr:MAG: hypothetical protein BMS9Abin37_2524 [Acidobacteriota bacterium]